MPANRWGIDSNGAFLYGGFYEPAPGPGQFVVTLPDEAMPDVVHERYDANSPTKRRPATAQELADAAQAADEAAATTARAAADPIVRGVVAVLSDPNWRSLPQEQVVTRIHAEIRRHRS